MGCIAHRIDLANDCPDLQCPVCRAQSVRRWLSDVVVPGVLSLPIVMFLM